MSPAARLLVTVGLLLVAVGILLPWLARLPLGHLPGDLVVRREGFRLYAPITTCAVVSVAMSLLVWFLRR